MAQNQSFLIFIKLVKNWSYFYKTGPKQGLFNPKKHISVKGPAVPTAILKVVLNQSCFFRIRYDAGDHVAIYPTNDVTLVNRIGELLSLDLDTVFTMKNLDEDSTKRTPFPCPTTYRTGKTFLSP